MDVPDRDLAHWSGDSTQLCVQSHPSSATTTTTTIFSGNHRCRICCHDAPTAAAAATQAIASRVGGDGVGGGGRLPTNQERLRNSSAGVQRTTCAGDAADLRSQPPTLHATKHGHSLCAFGVAAATIIVIVQSTTRAPPSSFGSPLDPHVCRRRGRGVVAVHVHPRPRDLSGAKCPRNLHLPDGFVVVHDQSAPDTVPPQLPPFGVSPNQHPFKHGDPRNQCALRAVCGRVPCNAKHKPRALHPVCHTLVAGAWRTLPDTEDHPSQVHINQRVHDDRPCLWRLRATVSEQDVAAVDFVFFYCLLLGRSQFRRVLWHARLQPHLLSSAERHALPAMLLSERWAVVCKVQLFWRALFCGAAAAAIACSPCPISLPSNVSFPISFCFFNIFFYFFRHATDTTTTTTTAAASE